MKKLIVVDGVDGSGKQTQVEKLVEYLSSKGENVKKISFPDYDSPSSSLVKMYLGGEFGTDPNDVNGYAASVFYAIDRYASFKKSWGSDFADGNGYIIADRYTTANMVHQAAKIDDTDKKEELLKWIDDLEYNHLELPRPDSVIFLNMPPWASAELRKDRNNKISGEKAKDIHERNEEYMKKSYDNAIYVANKMGWNIINCVDGKRIKTLDEISSEIKSVLMV